MFPITNDILDKVLKRLGITDITKATIRQICSVAAELEKEAGEQFIHLEIGNPGLPAAQVGIDAECSALQKGIANKYPAIQGIPVLKENAARFAKAFIDVDLKPECIIPTVGSMQGSFTLMLLLKHLAPEKDTMLFLNPGFPAQRTQAHLLELREESFDIYDYRGKKLEEKLESYFRTGRIAAMIYSNPNNPAWTNLTEEELEIIGRLATKYDVIIMEDLAYMGMDFRADFSKPFQAPFVPTVAKYTDNYILLMSASKIFSYAGQRIALVGMSDKVACCKSDTLKDFFGIECFIDAYIFGVLYAASSGTSHSAQFALAAMLEAAAEGTLDFVDASREYGRRAEIVKRLLDENGFHIVYAIDGDQPISDGFFFTAGYKDLSSAELQSELIRYGISAISLPSTGSDQDGVRICVSMISSDDAFKALESRLKSFNQDH